jgi:hypothetical protein
MKKIIWLFLILTFSFEVPVFADEKSLHYSAELYEQKSNKTKKLYTELIDESPTSVKVEIKDLDGKLVFSDETQLDGAKAKSYSIKHLQLNAVAKIEVVDKRVKFTKTLGQHTEQAEEDLNDNLVVPGNFNSFILEHWAELQKGDSVKMRYAVWDRQETIGFLVKKVGEENLEGTATTLIKLKPSSLVISALVDPLIFNYTMDGKRLLKQNGRVDPKLLKEGRWTDLDAEVYFSYPKNP